MQKENTLNRFKVILKLWEFSSSRRRRQAIYLLILLNLCGFLELISLASVVPFLIFITDPNSLRNNNLISDIFNFFNINTQSEVLLTVTLFFITAAIATMIVRVATLYLQGFFSALVGADFSEKVFEITLNKNYQWHLNKNSSEIITDLTQNISNVGPFIKSFLNILTQSSIAIFLLVGLFIVDGFSALTSALIFFISYILIGYFQRKKIYQNAKFTIVAKQKILKILQESYILIKEVLLNNLQQQYIWGYRKLDRPSRKRGAENQIIAASPRYVLEAICLILFASLGFFYNTTKANPTQVISSLGTLAIGAQKLLPAFQQIYNDWASTKSYFPAVMSILNIISSEKKTDNLLVGDSYEFNKVLEFQNLSFSYDKKEKIVLKDINLKINKGQIVGIIGATGGGKSTLVDLLMALLVPQKGTIKVDGKEINFANQESINNWRSNISHVPQDIYLLDDKITNNIAFELDEKNIDIERVYDSSKKAKIFDFINSLSKGFDTFVGERGVRLSGGQKQRIGIARALYKKSNILIFDEATSALDNQTEKEVMKFIDNLIDEDITVILIAHRLSTLRKCDVIFEVSNSSVHKVDLKTD